MRRKPAVSNGAAHTGPCPMRTSTYRILAATTPLQPRARNRRVVNCCTGLLMVRPSRRFTCFVFQKELRQPSCVTEGCGCCQKAEAEIDCCATQIDVCISKDSKTSPHGYHLLSPGIVASARRVVGNAVLLPRCWLSPPFHRFVRCLRDVGKMDRDRASIHLAQYSYHPG